MQKSFPKNKIENNMDFEARKIQLEKDFKNISDSLNFDDLEKEEFMKSLELDESEYKTFRNIPESNFFLTEKPKKFNSKFKSEITSNRKEKTPYEMQDFSNKIEQAILEKRKFEQMEKHQNEASNSKVQKDIAEVEIDGEKVDISTLPINIKKLLISGILDRKKY